MARKRRAKYDISHLKSKKFSRRHFMVRSAAGIAGAAMATAGFAWGDLAYAQQLKGKPAKFNVAIRPDWTQGWFGMINEEKRSGRNTFRREARSRSAIPSRAAS